jgi:hypothetical protein
MARKEFPLSLVIRAVDKATAPLRKINKQISDATKPVRKLNNSFRALAAEAGLPKLVKGFGGVGRSIRSVGREVLGLGAKIATMAAGAGLALYGVVQSAVQAGDDLVTLAERAGLGVDAYAQLQYAAAQADVEQTEFNTAMDQFTKRLGEAKAGSGSLLAFLENVSPALARQVQGARDTEQAFALMTGAFERVTDPAKRAALANAAFGRSGMQMGVFLGRGSKAIAEQRRRYIELSGSQERFAEGAGALDEAMRETQTAFLGLRNAAMAELFPAFTELAKAATEFLVQNRDGIATWAKETGAALSEWVKSGGIDRLATGLKEFGGAVKIVVERSGGLKTVLVGIAAVMGSGVIASVAGLAGSLWNLGAAVLPIVTRCAVALWPVLKGIGTALASSATAAAPFVAAAAGVAAAGAEVYRYWSNIKELFDAPFKPGGLFSTLKEIGSDPFAAFKMLDPRQALRDFGILGPSKPKTLGADAAATGTTRAGEARVTVDFNNLPRGTRVSMDPRSTAEVDLSRGYSMAGG